MPWTMRRTRNQPRLHQHRGETTKPEQAAHTRDRDKPPEAPPGPPSSGSRRSAKASPRLLFGRGPSGLWSGWVVVRVVWWWLSLLAVAGQCSPRRGDPARPGPAPNQRARTGTSRTGAPPVRCPATRPATVRARLTERTVHGTEQDASRTGTSRNEPGPQRTPAPNPPTRPPPAASGCPRHGPHTVRPAPHHHQRWRPLPCPPPPHHHGPAPKHPAPTTRPATTPNRHHRPRSGRRAQGARAARDAGRGFLLSGPPGSPVGCG